MNKITTEHLARSAYIYIRQSTAEQLRHNPEGRRRQYGLAERARQLGWSDVVVVDDDLGTSGGGVVRPGFDRLLAAIGRGAVGAVLAVEASRLARNGRDWHTLLEFCALLGTLILDEDGIYDPRSPSDRLLLGMKGSMSELELALFRQRSLEAIKLKAARGELHTTVAIGYVRAPGDRIEKEPDRRVRESLDLVFRKFAELQSVRQVLLWLRQEGIELPAAMYGPEGRAVRWKLPIYHTVLHILTNPVYGGAYVFGRTESRARIHEGRKRVGRGYRRPREEWQVLLKDHHEGYIDWDTYERNQRIIADNANMKGEMARGALRRGEALLAGLLRCGQCGRKLHVAYGGAMGQVGRYHCKGGAINHGVLGHCLSIGSLRIDQAVSNLVLDTLRPLGLKASFQVIDRLAGERDEKQRQLELAAEQARFEVVRARRQYEAVDPENRLVAAELESRWDSRLETLARLEREGATIADQATRPLCEADRQRLIALGRNLERVWTHPAAPPELRKRLVRTLLHEIVVRPDGDTLALTLHWQGGCHTQLRVPRNATGQHRWKTHPDTEALIQALARLMPDPAIAALLNRWGHHTSKGHTWTEARVRSFRADHGIAVYREGERAERGELTLAEAAETLGVSTMTVLRLIRLDLLPARQLCRGAPWVIRRADIEGEAVQTALRTDPKRPSSADGRQTSLEFQ